MCETCHSVCMDYETISVGDFGKSLRGIGINLLVRDVIEQCRFLEAVLDVKTHRV